VPRGSALSPHRGSGDEGSVLGHRAAGSDGMLCLRERKRVGRHPPLHQVVSQPSCLDRWIGVTETRGFIRAAREYVEAAKRRVGLLSQRPVYDQHTLPTKLGSVGEVPGLEASSSASDISGASDGRRRRTSVKTSNAWGMVGSRGIGPRVYARSVAGAHRASTGMSCQRTLRVAWVSGALRGANYLPSHGR